MSYRELAVRLLLRTIVVFIVFISVYSLYAIMYVRETAGERVFIFRTESLSETGAATDRPAYRFEAGFYVELVKNLIGGGYRLQNARRTGQY